MGRWKLGEGLPRACWGWGPQGPGLTGDFGALSSHGDPGRITGHRIHEALAQLCLRRPWALSAGAAQGLGRKGAWAFEHLPFSQTRGSAVASSTCSTRTAFGSAAGLSTWYLLSSWAPPLSALLPPVGGGGGRSEADGRGGAGPGGAGRGGATRASRPFSPLVSQPGISASLQDRMVLLVMGNIINWSL